MHLILSLLIVSIFSIGNLMAQNAVKSVMLDSVMVSAVKRGFSVEDFFDLMKNDTTLYKSFRRIRKYPHKAESVIRVLNRETKEKASIKRKTTHHADKISTWMNIDEEKIEGKMFNNKGEHNYITAELFDYIFFSKDTLYFSIGKRDDVRKNEKVQAENYKDKLKVMIFNPGTKIDGVPIAGKKMGIFEPEMAKYYDFLLESANYNDSIPCYKFTCRLKANLKKSEKEETVVRYLETWFAKSDFGIIARKYTLAYKTILFDFDVNMDMRLERVQGVLIPVYIDYFGNWDIPFRKPEFLHFNIRLFDFVRRQ